MSITIGGKIPQSISIDGKTVASLSINGEIVWPDTPSGPDYFYIENSYNGQNTVTIHHYPNITRSTDLEYNNGNGWTACDLTQNSTSITLTARGQKLLMRSSTGYNSYNTSNTYRNNITSTHEINVGGNIASLVDYTDMNSVRSLSSGEFQQIFMDSKIVDSSRLHFGNISSIGNVACARMFYNSTLLINTPDMSSITSVDAGAASGMGGMNAMFMACSSLQHGADLTGITYVANKGIDQLYQNCTTLIDAYAPNVSSWPSVSSWMTSVAASGVVYVPSGLCIGSGSGCIPENSVNGIPFNWTYDTY